MTAFAHIFALFCLLFFPIVAWGQTSTYQPLIIDKATHLPIPFCKAFRRAGTIYFYSDEHGKLIFPALIKSQDTLIISRIGYSSITVHLSAQPLSDTLELTREPVMLNEIRIQQEKKRTGAGRPENEIIGTIKQKRKTNFMFCEPDIVGLFIPNPQNEANRRIKSILAMVSNPHKLKEGYITLRVHQATSADHPPGPVLYSRKITSDVVRKFTTNNLLEVAVDSLFLFPTTGVYISFQWFTACPGKDEMYDQIGLQVTESMSESMTWVKLRKPEPPTWYREGTPYSVSWRFPQSFRLLNAMMGVRVE